MDLWDLTKILFRRWYVAGPLLIVTSVAVIFVGKGVQPDYSATGHLQMIPPTANDTPATTTNRNPWADLGPDALGMAATIKITDQSVVDSLVAQGLTDSFTVSPKDAVVTIEAVASTPEKATATVRKVMALLAADVVAEQAPYRLASDRTFTTLALDDGSSVKVVTSKVKRSMAVTAGASLLLTIAGTLGFDSVIRRRQNRQSRQSLVGADNGGMLPLSGNGYQRLVGAEALQPVSPPVPNHPPVTQPPTLTPSPMLNSGVLSSSPALGPSVGNDDGPILVEVARSTAIAPSSPAIAPTPAIAPMTASETEDVNSTIVLPLSVSSPSRTRKDNGGPR